MILTRTEKVLWRFGQAAGIVALLLFPNYRVLVFSSHDARLHSAVPLTNVALAPVIDIALVGGLLAIMLDVLRRTRLWPWWRLLIASLLPPLLLWRNAPFLPWPRRVLPVSAWPPELHTILLIALAWSAILFLARFSQLPLRAFAHLGNIALASAGVFALIVSIQLVRIAMWQPGPREVFAHSRKPADHRPDRARIVWIVLDELSQDQTFDHRAPDLPLPSFDALRAQSTLYSHVQPAGDSTSAILPSLFLGTKVDRANYTASNQYIVQFPGDPEWHVFDTSRTIFADARARGWTSAIAGWWNPYCPVFGSLVESCFWSSWDPFDAPMSLHSDLPNDMLAPFRFLAKDLARPAWTAERRATFSVQQRRLSFDDLYARSLSLLKTTDADLVFIHLPVPHPPGLYDRRTARFADTAGHSYLDNLALADRTLGGFVDALQQSPRWPRTALIVNGDHSWRTKMWRRIPGWTAEDERASRGIFDDRPLLMVHQPGQTKPLEISSPWPLLRMRELLNGLMGSLSVVSYHSSG